MPLACGARGTRTPGPLLANRRQHVHSSTSAQVTVPERAPVRSDPLLLLYFPAVLPSRCQHARPRRRVAGQSQQESTAPPSRQARTPRALDDPDRRGGRGVGHRRLGAARIAAGLQPGHPGEATPPHLISSGESADNTSADLLLSLPPAQRLPARRDENVQVAQFRPSRAACLCADRHVHVV